MHALSRWKSDLQAHLHDLLLAESFERHVLALVLHEHDLPKGA